MSPYETFDVAVDGGNLRVARWGDAADPVVFAIHGVTANHTSWALVAKELDGRACVVAPDLRGRGRSGGLPGPYGMGAHADDLVAVADHLGLDQVPLAGHSMGAYVAASTAARHPDRVSSVLLIDGGIPLPVPPGLTVDQLLQAIIGPAMARLSMTFETPEAYREYWRPHPALAEDWGPAIENYVDYDLIKDGDVYRSSVSIDAVRGDSEDMLLTDSGGDFARVKCPLGLLRAPRGLFNEETPLISDAMLSDALAAAPELQDLGMIPDVNHYTLSLSKPGAAFVADAIEKQLLS